MEKSYLRVTLCLVAGPGIEPGSRAYETLELPLLYPASVINLSYELDDNQNLFE